jgi:MFS family permease
MEDIQVVDLILSAEPSPGMTSRFGRRRPWIFVGGLLFMWRATSIPLLFIGYCLVELFSNIALATLVATIPDQVPENQRGTVSGIFGLATGLGGILGAILAGQIFKSAPKRNKSSSPQRKAGNWMHE